MKNLVETVEPITNPFESKLLPMSDEQPMPEFSSEEIDFRATSEAFTSIYNLKPQG